MASKTISITIPEQLEEDLQKEADTLGISRSRFIGNILFTWQKKHNNTNNCKFNTNSICSIYEIKCQAPQHEAETCAGYESKN